MGLKEFVSDKNVGKELREKRNAAEQTARLFSEATEQFQPTPEVQFGIDLAQKIKERINLGFDNHDLGRMASQQVGVISHDKQYSVDELAEEEIKKHFKNAWELGHNYGYITEEQGLVLPPSGKAELIYFIDPVDGSRMTQRDTENGTVTMVAVPGDIPNPTFSDIQFAITAPIKTNHDILFHTKRIENSQKVIQLATTPLDGVDIVINQPVPERGDLLLSLNSSSLVHESHSVSPLIVGTILEDILGDIDFKVEFPSGSFGLLQLIMGQHDLYLDMRKRLFDEFPHLPIKIGDAPKAAMPLDIAAGWFMLQALGGKMTDAYGNDLDNLPLWSLNDNNEWTSTSQISIIAAATPALHHELLTRVNKGVSRVKRLENVLQQIYHNHSTTVFPQD